MATINLPGAYPADAIRRASTGFIDPNDLPVATPDDFADIYTGVKPAIANDFAPISGGGNPQLGTPTVTLGITTATSQVVNTTSVANATAYVYKYNTSNTQTGATTFYTGSALTATATGLTASTLYYYFVVPTAANYTNGAAGAANASTLAPAANDGTDLATDFATSENLVRTGNNVASTDPSSLLYKGVHALHLPGTGIGWIQFTISTTDTGVFILSPGLGLPAGAAYGNKHAISRGYGNLITAYSDSDRTESFALTTNAILRLETALVGGVRSMLYRVSSDNGATFTTVRTEATDGSVLQLKVLGQPFGINGIQYGGDFTLV